MTACDPVCRHGCATDGCLAATGPFLVPARGRRRRGRRHRRVSVGGDVDCSCGEHDDGDVDRGRRHAPDDGHHDHPAVVACHQRSCAARVGPRPEGGAGGHRGSLAEPRPAAVGAEIRSTPLEPLSPGDIRHRRRLRVVLRRARRRCDRSVARRSRGARRPICRTGGLPPPSPLRRRLLRLAQHDAASHRLGRRWGCERPREPSHGHGGHLRSPPPGRFDIRGPSGTLVDRVG